MRWQLTPSLFTRRLLVFSPSTKLMASIKLDFPTINYQQL